MKRFFLYDQFKRDNCIQMINSLELKDKNPYEITIKEATRKMIQNDKMWAMLADISNQVEWYGMYLQSEEWKDVLSASLFNEKMVPAIGDRKMVLLGKRTSFFTIARMAEMIEFMYAFGAEHNVRWSK